ncbi:MAG: N-acetylornithine carbamoyltransferase, partial [Bacteroidota bacterium]
MKHFTSVNDVPNLELLKQDAQDLASHPNMYQEMGKGRTLGMIFFNPSLRTRMSTQRAAHLLGLSTIVMNIGKEGWNLEFEDGVIMNGDKAEHIRDAASVMGQYCDIIGIRAFAGLDDQKQDYSEPILNAFKQYAGVPILSLESATLHPCQSFADVLTIEKHKHSKRPKVVLTWAPHPKALPQAVANSFVQWMQQEDVDFVLTHPKGYELGETFLQGVHTEYEQRAAFENADFIYAKNWSSFHSYGKVLPIEENWMVTSEKMNLTHNAHFMHCLPVRRNVVVSDAVIDSPNSLVKDQALHRVVAVQTVLVHM